MPRLKSLDDLMRLRSEAQRSIKARMDIGTVITVAMGTCGIAAGARETMNAILAELGERQIDAQVVTAACVGQCAKEPFVDIAQAGLARIAYGNVKPDMVPRLIEEHLIQGRPVEEWVVGRQDPVPAGPVRLAGAAGAAGR